jgi:hypothetical protein
MQNDFFNNISSAADFRQGDGYVSFVPRDFDLSGPPNPIRNERGCQLRPLAFPLIFSGS